MLQTVKRNTLTEGREVDNDLVQQPTSLKLQNILSAGLLQVSADTLVLVLHFYFLTTSI